tara:strand:+ start:3413 stop:3724 length:312 start_codon:yes stop_codon:yes gene_type:complete
MDEEQYKTYISSIINRLNNEKRIYPEIKKSSNSNKTKIKILISQSEWYNELDDDTKYNVEYNLKKFYTLIILENIQEFIKDNKNTEEENIETFNHTSKRLKFD